MSDSTPNSPRPIRIRDPSLNTKPSSHEPPDGSSDSEMTFELSWSASRKSKIRSMSHDEGIQSKVGTRKSVTTKINTKEQGNGIPPKQQGRAKSQVTRRQTSIISKKKATMRTNQRRAKREQFAGEWERGKDHCFEDVEDVEDVDIIADNPNAAETDSDRVNNLIEEWRKVPGKKKLILSNLRLTQKSLHVSSLPTDLHKLSLSGNPLFTLPGELVTHLYGLKTLDLSQCNLMKLPDKWNLPNLRILDLRHNGLETFPEEAVFKGIPKLENLDMYGNKVCEIIIPHDTSPLKNLSVLNVGFNNIPRIPEELCQLLSLQTLIITNNVIEIIPEKICNMNLKVLNVTSNPLIQPPIETCERGIGSMKRYYDCLLLEKSQQLIARQKSDAKDAKKSARQRKVRKRKESLNSPKKGSRQQTFNKSPLLKTESPLLLQDDIVLDSKNGTRHNDDTNDITMNDTLKVIVVGMALAGKTTIITRLTGAKIPAVSKRTVGVHIHSWKPFEDKDKSHINTLINLGNDSYSTILEDAHVKFSVWDFAGQHVYHASHELFFCKRALYILVWDMGANNDDIFVVESKKDEDPDNEFGLSSDEEDNEDDRDRVVAGLEKDIDDKVQFWVDCIQNRVHGAAILIVATHNDCLEENEAQRRCEVMKERILWNEEKRIKGLKDRRKEFKENKSEDTEAARRIRAQLSDRPKVLFGKGENDVVRVSGKNNQGFDQLTEKIVNIATGRELFKQSQYPIFRGHIGARIPRMRFLVRDVVQEMRSHFKVVAGSHFMDKLIEKGVESVPDVIDALYFLADVGEISYFGDICKRESSVTKDSLSFHSNDLHLFLSKGNNFDTEVDSANGNSALPTLTTHFHSQYIFLNPRWLMSAISCILRHDLSNQLEKLVKKDKLRSSETFGTAGQHHFPVISAKAADLLWREGGKTKHAEGRISESVGEDNVQVLLFDFLQELLIQFRVFVPINLNIDIEFGGKGLQLDNLMADSKDNSPNPRFYFLPSLLSQNKPSDDVWDYKNNEIWKETVCHSFLIGDSSPPGLMERITASILSEIHTLCDIHASEVYDRENEKIKPCNTKHLCIKQIHCWQKTLILSTALTVTDKIGGVRRSKVELFVHLAEKDDKLCVASGRMAIGTRRLIICGKGHALDIWNGGYGIVKRIVDDVFHDYRGLDFEEQGICPSCLRTKSIGEAGIWDWSLITSFTQQGHDTIRCSEGDCISKRSLCLISNQEMPKSSYVHPDNDSELNVKDYLPKVVLVGLWDGDKDKPKIIFCGSGFIVDKKRGLIMTAAHVLIQINDKKDFGKDYYGEEKRRVVIGIIPDDGNDGTQVVFRYFAKIIAKDKKMNGREKCCQIDACVLQITSRMKCDVDGNGDSCGEQEEHVIMTSNMENEKLKEIKILRGNCEINQPVHFIGFNQGGEGLRAAGEVMNRNFDFTKGYVIASKIESNGATTKYRLCPVAEVVVYSRFFVGHSGGPCINIEGKVIGMVCRNDPFEKNRCYLVPSEDLRRLLTQARKSINA